MARGLRESTSSKVDSDSFTLTFEPAVELESAERAIEMLRGQAPDLRPAVDEQALEGLKFSECLPVELATEMLEERLRDPEATRRVLEKSVRGVVL